MLLWSVELTISNISMCVKMLMDSKAYAMKSTLQVPLQEVTYVCSYILPPNSNDILVASFTCAGTAG